MSLVAGATLLNGIGHLANLGQFVEIGQGQAFQREQMQWARRAYCLDSRALRIDLLNAVKEDVRDHHQTYASRIDTLLVVHTLLLTFALATLQYSDQFVPVSGCVECEENEHPWLVTCWVYAVSGILILPFWGIVLLIWSKLQLDHWLENSIGRLNVELRQSLSADVNVESLGDREGTELLERVEGAVTRLSSFVVEHQESFKRVWNQECRFMISAATVFLWVSCVLAILITAGMFWLFLQNHMTDQHRHAATHFALCARGVDPSAKVRSWGSWHRWPTASTSACPGPCAVRKGDTSTAGRWSRPPSRIVLNRPKAKRCRCPVRCPAACPAPPPMPPPSWPPWGDGRTPRCGLVAPAKAPTWTIPACSWPNCLQAYQPWRTT
ncbi:unnamed protein product [Durusdinium trenchii]|uniref:Uncharacterized protein n=1 Tax=Durusdinium trenchii TaxID=1381693 RepID=A0ABP0MHF1_9DINO